uniref:Putative ixostatin n=1 Tax=Ixodes ricinus TaxID=34613 RepID=A0A0K8RK23_IXORI
MNKAIIAVFVTSHLLYQAPALKLQNWKDMEQNIGNSSCMKHLKTQMDEACKQLGESTMVTVDFAKCKMGCQKDAAAGSVKTYDMPNDTNCGFYDEKCQNGICLGQCEMESEEPFESPGIDV